jgi:protoheme IX farnesyltransferase
MSARLRGQLRTYFELTKSLQTGLLLTTGIAGFTSAVCPMAEPVTLLALSVSLLLAISGSTVLNMVYDRDIDARMPRTMHRALPAGTISPREALAYGLLLSLAGLTWAWLLSPGYFVVVFAGWFIDIFIYTIWLKRRTAWAIIWGGVAGGMPALAGRVLAVGQVDWVGLALAAAVLLWIPTHIMTFSLRYKEDYVLAGIPTFPARYGEKWTQLIIAISSVLAAVAMGMSAVGLGMAWGYLRVLAILGVGLFVLALSSVIKPSARLNFGLFKYASIYMLGSMLLVVIEAI